MTRIADDFDHIAQRLRELEQRKAPEPPEPPGLKRGKWWCNVCLSLLPKGADTFLRCRDT